MYRHIKGSENSAPPKKKTRWVILPFSVWHGNSMTHTKIIPIRATIVWFWFWKHVQICGTIFVKRKCELLRSEKNWLNSSQRLITYFENDTNRSALFRFQFGTKNLNCETILVNMECELLKSAKKRDRAVFGLQLWVQNMEYTKTALLSLYIWLIFNNAHTILTRIISQF